MLTTGDELRAARKALGMTQKQLAEFLELTGENPAATVRAWENGRRTITGPARVAIRLELERRGLALRALAGER